MKKFIHPFDLKLDFLSNLITIFNIIRQVGYRTRKKLEVRWASDCLQASRQGGVIQS